MGLDVAKEKLSGAILKAKKFIVGDTRQKKLDIILDHLIDSIELRGNDVLITTKKNIAIQNDGHLVQINTGTHVLLSKEIHLNPKIEFKTQDDFTKVQAQLDYARELEDIALQKKIEEFQKQQAIDCSEETCGHN